jgi:signal transduction histidine kinase
VTNTLSSSGTQAQEQQEPVREAPRAPVTKRGLAVRTWSLQRRLGYSFAVAGALLLAGCIIGGLALDAMISAIDLQTNRLDPAARYTSYYFNTLINQETGVRGYIITHQRSFLQPYDQGLRTGPADLATVRNLIGPYPRLRADLRTVVARADVWHSAYALPSINEAGRHLPVSTTRELLGKRDFDAFRAATRVFTNEILAERAAAEVRLQRATTEVLVIAITGAALLVLGAAAAWAGLGSWVRRPLESLRREAQAVAAGQLDHQVDLTGPLEIMDLAADVEAMRRQLLLSLDNVSFKAAELERSNRELEQFAYVASHDLQEPLRKVASFCQMLESRYSPQLDERARQYIAYAVDGAKRMQTLINDLLAFSRVGQQGAHMGAVELNAAADDAITGLEAAIEDTDADVTIGKLPAVYGDRALLTQLFQNLITNSIKFRRVDEPPVVRISANRKDDMWEFSCQDNGIGIEPAYAERVFVIFQRLHPRDAYPGTGIGLALCRKIVDFHGGRIWIDTDPAATPGTIIRWTLPGYEKDKEVTDGAR